VSGDQEGRAFSRGPEAPRLSPAERDNLVAYLDGELNDAESRAIATKLTMSPTARREIEALERTWELLDHLPRPQASEQLTERTLSEVRKLAEQGGALETAFLHATRRAAKTAIWIAGSVAALFVGIAVTAWVWPNPTARLARELSIAEHLDEYRDVGDFEYLKELASSPEFNAD
jgi:anti-sigma factor RsiW